MVKNPSEIPETWVRSLGWEDPLEEGMATHSSILAWRIPMDRGSWWATVHGVTKSRTHWASLVAQMVKNLPAVWEIQDVCHIFFIHSSVDGHLGCLHTSAIMNSCYEHRGACTFWDYSFVQIYTQEWVCWITW